MLYILILGFFWFIRTAKAILFWVYLWQLKEYHLGRFKAHFSTEKGRHLLFNKLLILKLVLAFGFFFYNIFLPLAFELANISEFLDFLTKAIFLPFILLILYSFESVWGLKNLVQRKLKKPVLTKKTIPILFFAFILFISIPVLLWQKIQQSQLIFDFPVLHKFCFWLLIIDIFTPLVISLIVLFFQPLTVLWRSWIIRKAKKKRKRFKNLLVIGITGSYGKTSTKEFLYAILSEKFGKEKVLKTKEHQNSEVGISQCILRDLKPEHKIFICEMGAYNKGGIKLLCAIVRPQIGILTGINQQHLATFGSQENIINTKFELLESLPENGIAIFNIDNEYIDLEVKKRELKVKSKFYSVRNKLDIWAEDVRVEREFISFKVFSKDGDSAQFKVDLLGFQNVENILASACCAKELGMNLEEISKACAKIKPMPGSGRLIKNKQGLNIIDASYSANPNGVISHLQYLRIWPGKKIIIMPCLIELGKASKKVHQDIGKEIGKVCDLAIITAKECYNNVKGPAVESGMPEQNILFLENSKQIFKKVNAFAKEGDVVLLEGRVSKELIKLLSVNY